MKNKNKVFLIALIITLISTSILMYYMKRKAVKKDFINPLQYASSLIKIR